MSHEENGRLSTIEENQQLILSTVNELKMAVIGSEKIGVEGLVPKVRRHEAYIEVDKKQKWMIAGAIVLATGVISIITMFLK